jgi:TolB-like protein
MNGGLMAGRGLIVSLWLIISVLLPTLAVSQRRPNAGIQPFVAMKKETVAVFEFEAIGAAKAEATAVTDRVQSALASQGKFILVDRQQIDKIMDEQAFQQTVCTSQECVVKVGRILGVRRIVAGRLNKFGDQVWHVSAQLIDVETAETIRSASIPVRGDFFFLLNEAPIKLADQLSGPTTGQPAAESSVTQPKPKWGPRLVVGGLATSAVFLFAAQGAANDAAAAEKKGETDKYNEDKSHQATSNLFVSAGLLAATAGAIIWYLERTGTISTSRFPTSFEYSAGLAEETARTNANFGL